MLFNIIHPLVSFFEEFTSPLMEGLIDLHHNILFLLILIFGVYSLLLKLISIWYYLFFLLLGLTIGAVMCCHALWIWFWKKKKENKNLLSFAWIFALIKISEDPSTYNLTPYENIIWSFFFLYLVFLLLIFIFRKKILSFFWGSLNQAVYNHEWFCKGLVLYSFHILKMKEAFEQEFYLLPTIFSLPNLFYIYNLSLEMVPSLTNPIMLMIYWFSVGNFLIVSDELSVKIVLFLEENKDHKFSVMLKKTILEKNSSIVLEASFFSRIGKLTAAGQGALLAGVIGSITTVMVTGINTHYNTQRDIRQHEADAQARADKAQAKARQHEADAQARADQAQAKTQARAADGQAKADKAQAKAQARADQARAEAQARADKAQQKHNAREWEAYNKSYNPFKKPPKPPGQ